MNRKQRRAVKSTSSGPAAPDAGALFAAAAQSHRDGRLADAQTLYRRIIALDPRHADALHRLGVIAYQRGEAAEAIGLFDRAVAADGGVAAYHVHRGLALAAAGRLDEASAACAAAAVLSPDSVEAHANLSIILLRSGRFDAAADAGRRTIALAPDLADGHHLLGSALHALGRSRDAIASYRRAVELAPDYAEAWTALGAAAGDLGQFEDAVAHHLRAIALAPDLAEAHRNLAGVLKALGRLEEAAASLRRAATLEPDHPGVLNNLALVLLAQGDTQGAMEAVVRGLAAGDAPVLHRTFVHCVTTLQIDAGGDFLRPLLTRALREGWGRPEDLVGVCLELAKQAPALRAAIARAADALDADEAALAALADDELLLTLLASTPNTDFEVERLLNQARRALLRQAEAGSALSPKDVALYAALAHQCFINEYVFGLAPGEADRARRLGERLSGALEAAEAPPAAWVLAVACYGPLSSLRAADGLCGRAWPGPMDAVLKTQIAEPSEEARLRREIPRLTPILETSAPVRAQYEENPYPRWIKTGAAAPETLYEHLRHAFPHAGVAPIDSIEPEVLIAGCGTGRNALETHRAFSGARTLAIDLSTASLSYAWRKTLEAGETRIRYAQADLLSIADLGLSFDVIEASGVLHHLADPFAGWRALLSVLRPGGVMRLGFYSALARRNLPDIDGAAPTPDTVRQARQALAMRHDPAARQALRAQDFYSVSGCRDLLFHTREHRLALGELAAFMAEADLRFVGFVVDDQVLARYRRRHPHDPGGRDLDAWAAFEQEHPDTFAKMYQFWVQKG